MRFTNRRYMMKPEELMKRGFEQVYQDDDHFGGLQILVEPSSNVYAVPLNKVADGVYVNYVFMGPAGKVVNVPFRDNRPFQRAELQPDRR